MMNAKTGPDIVVQMRIALADLNTNAAIIRHSLTVLRQMLEQGEQWSPETLLSVVNDGLAALNRITS